MKKLINLLLLTVMFFSIAHGVVLEDEFRNHCTIQEYVSEFDHAIEQHDEHKGDCCETHFMFHLSFLLPEIFSLFEMNEEVFVTQTHLLTNPYAYNKNSFRPPIFNI